jgi:hypothetical protein
MSIVVSILKDRDIRLTNRIGRDFLMTDQMADGRIEQRPLLRAEKVPLGATIVVRGGSDTHDKPSGFTEQTPLSSADC